MGAVPPCVLADAEAEVNQVLISDLAVRAFLTSIDEARAMGARALFGVKYGDEAPAVAAGTYSRALCARTPVARSAQLARANRPGPPTLGPDRRPAQPPV